VIDSPRGRRSEAGEPATPGATRPRSARASALALNLLLALVSATIVLGGAELVARLTEPPAAAAPADYITDWQAWQGDFYTVKSTAVGWPPWEDYNTEGLRDREHAVQKRPGSWRVACLGDSVTLGWGIRPQQAWPQVLEELGAASGHDLEVMNVALGGWSTRQELLAWRRIARRYRPDQVLLGICLNDVAEMQNNLSRPSRLLAELHRRSALVRRVVRAREREIGAVEELFTAAEAPRVRSGYERMFADLRTLRDEVRADGARFAVLVFPFRFQLAPGAPPPLAQRTIADFCRREGIAFLDLLPAITPLGEQAFHDYDHFNPAGARAVAQQVLDSGLLADRGHGEDAPAPAASSSPRPDAQRGAGDDPKPLIAALKAPVAERRAEAARALATLGETAAPAVPALTVALADSSHVVRAAAAWALGNVGPAAAPAVPALIRLLRDVDPFVRAGAAFGLGGVGEAAAGAAATLIDRLDDPDERVRWRAADALAKVGLDEASVEPLARLVQETTGLGRGHAAEALGRLGPAARSAVPELVAAASDSRPDVRWRAIWALGRIGPAAAPAVPQLRAALADPDLRWRAADALGAVGTRAIEARPELEALLTDPSSNVRWRAASALGAIGSRQSALPLARAVRDEAENVRLAAVMGLAQLGADGASVESAFLAGLGDADSRVRLHAVRGLGRLANPSPSALRALETARLDEDENVRAQAAKVLRRSGR
jgi:HEAT repeat protein/lysophospholipase L1-like esterase